MPASFVTLRTPRTAVSAFFLSAGMALGGWAASLPSISAKLFLDKGDLGIVLLCFALGAIATMTNTGRIVPRFGTPIICMISALVLCGALVAIPHSGTVWLLSLLAFVAGGGMGAFDVAMNTEAAFLEKRSARHLMSSFHGVFSIGSLVGAYVTGQLLRSGWTVDLCLAVVGICAIVTAFLAWKWSEQHENPSGEGPSSSSATLGSAQKRQLLLLGAVAFLALFAEGALMDWAAIYLVGTVGAAEATGAFGFAVFAGMMAVGRLFGDAATRKFNAEALFRSGAVMVAGGLALMLTVTSIPAVFVALAICGLGVANLIPAIFSGAGRIGGAAAGSAMSLVTTMGYSGLLVGPPFIGFLADATSLKVSLWVVACAMLLVASAAGLLRVGRTVTSQT